MTLPLSHRSDQDSLISSSGTHLLWQSKAPLLQRNPRSVPLGIVWHLSKHCNMGTGHTFVRGLLSQYRDRNKNTHTHTSTVGVFLQVCGIEIYVPHTQIGCIQISSLIWISFCVVIACYRTENQHSHQASVYIWDDSEVFPFNSLDPKATRQCSIKSCLWTAQPWLEVDKLKHVFCATWKRSIIENKQTK